MRVTRHERRKLTNVVMLGLCSMGAFLAVSVLALILGFVLVKGIAYINLDFFTQLPAPLGEKGGGVKNAIAGTMLTVGIASVIAIPFGIGAGVYVSEMAGPKLASAVRFVADIMTGVPSIVVGIVVYELVVLKMGHFSALAAGIALAIIMFPIMARSTEEMLKLVPHSQREAALALGLPLWRTILNVIIPAARRGLITGALLAIARAAGETAPLLFTALGNRFWTPISAVADQPIDSLPLRIYQYGTSPYQVGHEQAWAASFVLVMIVFLIGLVSRLLLSRR